jgi:hypothetical protein
VVYRPQAAAALGGLSDARDASKNTALWPEYHDPTDASTYGHLRFRARRLFGPQGPSAAAYGQRGQRASALKSIQGLKDPVDLGEAYTSIGDASKAVDSVARALDQREFRAEFIKVSPEFDSLRSDPRFRAQVARLKIPGALQ